MLEYMNCGFFNVSELEKWEQGSGLLLQRYPKTVREKMGSPIHVNGQRVSQEASGSEIRFVTESKIFRIRVSAVDNDSEILVYNGNFFHGRYILEAGKISSFVIEKNERYDAVETSFLQTGHFSPDVWRIMFGRSTCISFHSLETFGKPCRPPLPQEIPAATLLTYGSSITHSSQSLSQHNGYVHHAARRLKMDLLNLGVSGSCFNEKEVADWIISRTDWDAAFFEIGVNMRGQVDGAEYKIRLDHLIHGLQKHHAAKPKFFTTIYANHMGNQKNPNKTGALEIEFNDILRSTISTLNDRTFHLIEGKEILTSPDLLCADLIHPSDFGHCIMGENLARILSRII